ncbi:MAG TPA: DUF4197 domain-containing protein [Bacteroidia bacterium]|jgi:hypothetical protein|nr:DUF4197 domain-containing protein [Bacteroidia bacterium]HQF29028.1 DUF4197 domain-containing protein [Bacteroidia bacterium]HQK98388.1 DUF4197 domain-containing protein [Bacteroidia bacterium]
MKKYIIAILLFTAASTQAQININNVLNTVNSALGNGLSNDDIVKGLKEALNVGSNKASASASKTDGFYKNNLIKIPFPKEASEMRSTLLKIGMKKQVEEFEKQLNRAAEDAAKKAAPIFVSAVTKMTINDGITILRGKDDEATQYLRKTTNTQLTNEFKPVISASLKKVQITKYWKPLITAYNKIPFVKKANPNLDDYVTTKATDGLFILVAQEETKIRKDPAARVSDILKKVFGSK